MDSSLESGGQTVVAKNGPMAQYAKAQSSQYKIQPKLAGLGRPNIAARLVQSISYKLTCNRRKQSTYGEDIAPQISPTIKSLKVDVGAIPPPIKRRAHSL